MTEEERVKRQAEDAESRERARQLKDLIELDFKTVSEFARKTGIPRNTIDSILKRGVSNASVKNVIAICKALGIETDPFVEEGRIVPRVPADFEITQEELTLINQYRSLDSKAQNRVRQSLQVEYNDALASLPEESQNATGAG